MGWYKNRTWVGLIYLVFWTVFSIAYTQGSKQTEAHLFYCTEVCVNNPKDKNSYL